MDAFFKTLGEKGGTAAITEMCKGTLLETQNGAQLEAFGPQLDAAFKIYGRISRIESVDGKVFGDSFIRIRVIAYHASGAPMFWDFMFFRGKTDWEIYIFRFADQFDRVFGNNP